MRRRRLLAALFTLLMPASALIPFATRAADAGSGVTLTLDPVGTSTVTGLAVLTPRDGDTAANVLGVGAPAGAMAVIHAGSCTAIDPTPTGLLGDVGTTGQLAATVPVPFSTIADGGHVLVIHPGLDLATALACGAIPLAAATDSTPAPEGSGHPAGERFESVTFGFAVDWDDPWRRQEWDPGEGYEGLSLSNGTSSVSIVAFDLTDGDATVCVRNWESRLLGLMRAGTVAELQPVIDDQGQPVGGGDPSRAFGAYQYLYKSEDDPQGSPMVERDECRTLGGRSVIEITSDVPADAREDQEPLVDELIGRLVVTGRSVTPTTPPATSQPTPAATVAATPDPTPAPEPTPDAACVGMDVWVKDTLARFDAVKGMADDLATAMNAGMAAYAQALADTSVAVQRLQIEQQQAAVPVSAKDAQDAVVRMLQKLAEAYDLMAQAYASGNSAVLQQGLAAASEAQGLATSARAAIRGVATPCGITVPAV